MPEEDYLTSYKPTVLLSQHAKNSIILKVIWNLPLTNLPIMVELCAPYVALVNDIGVWVASKYTYPSPE